MIDYSRTWAIEALIDILNAVGRISESAVAYSVKGDHQRADDLNEIGGKLNDIMCQIEKIINIE